MLIVHLQLLRYAVAEPFEVATTHRWFIVALLARFFQYRPTGLCLGRSPEIVWHVRLGGIGAEVEFYHGAAKASVARISLRKMCIVALMVNFSWLDVFVFRVSPHRNCLSSLTR